MLRVARILGKSDHGSKKVYHKRWKTSSSRKESVSPAVGMAESPETNRVILLIKSNLGKEGFMLSHNSKEDMAVM